MIKVDENQKKKKLQRHTHTRRTPSIGPPSTARARW